KAPVPICCTRRSPLFMPLACRGVCPRDGVGAQWAGDIKTESGDRPPDPQPRSASHGSDKPRNRIGPRGRAAAPVRPEAAKWRWARRSAPGSRSSDDVRAVLTHRTFASMCLGAFLNGNLGTPLRLLNYKDGICAGAPFPWGRQNSTGVTLLSAWNWQAA